MENADLAVSVTNKQHIAVVLPSEAQSTVLDAVAIGDWLGQVVGDEGLSDDLRLEIPDLDSVADGGAQPATEK
jgi:hypothetical protein